MPLFKKSQSKIDQKRNLLSFGLDIEILKNITVIKAGFEVEANKQLRCNQNGNQLNGPNT